MNRLGAISAVTGLAFLALALGASFAGSMPSDFARAVTALSAVTGKERVQWNTAQARTADFTCDGKPDIVMFGIGNRSIWMGMVPGGGGKPQEMRFPLGGTYEYAFRAPPSRIEIGPGTCDDKDIGHLKGCRLVKGCSDFRFLNDIEDGFNFYWDHDRKAIAVWRR